MTVRSGPVGDDALTPVQRELLAKIAATRTHATAQGWTDLLAELDRAEDLIRANELGAGASVQTVARMLRAMEA